MSIAPPIVDRTSENYAWIRHQIWGSTDYGEPRKEKRFLCINGPRAGERLSWSELVIEKLNRSYRTLNGPARDGYCQYNNGGSGPESMIYVWFDT